MKKILALCAAVVLGLVIITGCTSKKGQTVAQVGKDKITVGELSEQYVDMKVNSSIKIISEKPEYEQLKETLTNKILISLEKRVPGISEHIVFKNLGTPLTNKHYINSTKGNLYGIDKTPRFAGPLAMSIKTEFEGLYMCGASTLSHGVSGATSTGLQAASQILGCKVSDLLTQKGAPIKIYPAEDISQWPENLQRKIKRGQQAGGN